MDPVADAPYLHDGKYYLNYRYCFTAGEGNSVYSCDYSSQELSIMAVESGDQFMIGVISKDEFIIENGRKVKNPDADLYSQVAAKAFGIPAAKAKDLKHPKLGKKCRDLAKISLLGAAYGKTEHSMPEDLGITAEEGKQLIRDIFKTMPQLEAWLEKRAELATKTRLSRFSLNRLRFLNDSRHADKGAVGRAGKNTPIQGQAALMMKKALIELDKALETIPNAMIIGSVHDEALCEIPDDLSATEDTLVDYEEYEPRYRLGAKTVLDAMKAGSRYFLRGIVPDKATCGIGRSWTK